MPASYTPVTITASATLDRTNAGSVVNLSAAAGLTVTLPAATGTGDVYRVFVLTTVTSNSYKIQVASASDVIQGGVALSTDIAGVTMLAAATSDTITLNGSTTGGLRGGYLEIRDVSSGIFACVGFLPTTGAEGTPWSAAV